MDNPLPTPEQISVDPELAALWILMANMDIARAALVASHPDLLREYPDDPRTEQEAYAMAIIHQCHALTGMVHEYMEGIGRLRQWRSIKPSQGDIAF